MEDDPSWFVVVFGVVVVIACSYIFCYYFPLIEPTNLDLPVKSPILVSRISSPNFRRMTFVPADSPAIIQGEGWAARGLRKRSFLMSSTRCVTFLGNLHIWNPSLSAEVSDHTDPNPSSMAEVSDQRQ